MTNCFQLDGISINHKSGNNQNDKIHADLWLNRKKNTNRKIKMLSMHAAITIGVCVFACAVCNLYNLVTDSIVNAAD